MTDRQANVKLRSYQTHDCMDIIALFYQTVHRINKADYTEQQLNVWVTGNEDPIKWDRSLSSHYAIVAIVNDQIVGFGDIDQTGYLDRLFVHSDFQRQGIATAICNALEEKVVQV
ncbi:GNAT family N-acetyltransferase [Limosilactobacillus reuteri]|uniref:GNAT family N-acetyltransferase n=1 Tax=Limosilactobacillus reuteri TaxID=1598 RepID=UPI001E2C027D|nr:GNAT family N-acetyltransferase [Limosilactobacillus reuteri]MCC4422454.1 GNAT family N-acetyltransferase [Limosilactobacillus reuteri]